MVEGQDRIGPGLGDVVEALDLEAVEGPEDDGQHVPEGAGRQREEDGRGGRKIGKADEADEYRGMEPRGLQQRHDHGTADHEDRGEDIHGPDGARPLRRAAPHLQGGKDRHDEQPGRNRQAEHVDRGVQASGMAQECRRPEKFGRERGPSGHEGQIDREEPHQGGRDRGRQQDHAPCRQPGRERRADGDADRKHRDQHGDGGFASPERVLDQRRQQGQDHGAYQPEPAGIKGAAPQAILAPEVAEEVGGRTEDVGIDPQIWRALPGRRDQGAGQPAQHRKADHQNPVGPEPDRSGRGFAPDDGSEQDGQKGAALDERIAAGQFLGREMIRQDAVFDRREQSRDGAHQHQGREQDRQRRQQETDHRQTSRCDLEQLQPSGHQGLVVAVRQFAAEPRQQQRRRHEQRTRDRDQGSGACSSGLEQDQEHQRVLENVVVEGRKELAPEQRREAPGHHQ